MKIFNKIDQKVTELKINRVIKFIMKIYNFIAFENMVINLFIILIIITYINNNGGDAASLLSESQIDFIMRIIIQSIDILLFSIVIAIPFLFRRSFFVLIWAILIPLLIDTNNFSCIFATFLIPLIIFTIKIIRRKIKTKTFSVNQSEKIYLTTIAISTLHILGMIVLLTINSIHMNSFI